MKRITYIGSKATKTDNLSGSGLTWQMGETLDVDDRFVERLLQHPDIWVEEGKAPAKRFTPTAVPSAMDLSQCHVVVVTEAQLAALKSGEMKISIEAAPSVPAGDENPNPAYPTEQVFSGPAVTTDWAKMTKNQIAKRIAETHGVEIDTAKFNHDGMVAEALRITAEKKAA